MKRAARSYDVYFFEEPIFATGVGHLQTVLTPDGVTVVTPVLPPALPDTVLAGFLQNLLDGLLREVAPISLTTWYYTPAALTFSRHLRPSLCVYDNMDELSAFKGASPALVTLERELLRRSHLVFTGGHSIYEAKRNRHSNIHAFPSSIDAAHFRGARTAQSEVPEHAGLPRPRLGFFGVIDERMDVELVARLSDLRPDWQIVMIGPVVKIDPAELPRRSNIHWLGGRQYDQLPAFLAGWDVGIMPFALNDATRFISPTKTPEFLAAGIPVVSTAITDVVRPYGTLGLVEIARTAEEMVAGAERCLARQRAPWLERVDAFLAGTSWDRTWSEMLGLMIEASDAIGNARLAPGARTAAVHV